MGETGFDGGHEGCGGWKAIRSQLFVTSPSSRLGGRSIHFSTHWVFRSPRLVRCESWKGEFAEKGFDVFDQLHVTFGCHDLVEEDGRCEGILADVESVDVILSHSSISCRRIFLFEAAPRSNPR